MKGRAVWGVLAVSLLVLPVMLLVVLWMRAPAEREVEGWRFMPWLTPGEFRELRTLRQPCREDAQCDPRLICFRDPRFPQRQCTASGCESDAWCAPYGVCRAMPLPGQRVALRACVFEGTREEGEQCLRWAPPGQREWACGEGLVCGLSGWCGRRCVPGKEGSCPEGFFCARGDPDGPVCQPSCEGRACPEGQECVRRAGGVSVCASVIGRRCLEKPCPENKVCETETMLAVVGAGWRTCVQPCGKDGDDTCPEDFRCHEGRCRRRCSTQQPGSCGATQFCVSTDDEGNGLCLFSPEPWSATPAPARDGG
ncbi:hypothetical protein [Archangium sp.]|jgi:hypothetical protein|uniref:hypothetical protein n=1 Tax=Archangium sp. TaxID=1872627 RepID=UPI002ED7B4C6